MTSTVAVDGGYWVDGDFAVADRLIFVAVVIVDGHSL